MFHKVKLQKGFAIISALFLIVVLAFLGIAMARVFTTGQQAINQDITSLQAYYAGQSGLQWGMYQAVYAGAAGTHTVTFNNAGLAGTNVEVDLQPNTLLGQTYYLIDADGEFGNLGPPPDPEYAMRRLQVHFRRP